MKICFVLGYPNPFAGAAWTRIGFLASKWSDKGHKVDVLGVFNPSTYHKIGVKNLSKVNIFNLIPNGSLNHPIIFLINLMFSFIVSALFVFRRRPDIMIVSMPKGDVGLGSLMVCRLLGIKYVVDYRDEWEEYAVSVMNSKSGKAFYSKVKHFANYIYNSSLLLVTVTFNCEIALKQRGLVNVKLVPNGADITTFKPLPTKINRQFTLFYSGGIGLYYRLDVVLKALKRFVDNGAKDAMLIIAGDGAVNQVLSMVSQLGLSKNVRYIGVIQEKTELAHLIANVDVGLIPYDDNPLWKNALPAKFFEYCACGLPVIATVYDDSLLGKLIRDNSIGIISSPLNEVKLAEAFYELFCNTSFRESAGEKARLLIMEKFDRNKIAEEYLKLIMGSKHVTQSFNRCSE